jgi:hypothetical protein
MRPRDRAIARTKRFYPGPVGKKAREEELAKERRRRDGWVTRYRLPVQAEERSSDQRLGVRARLPEPLGRA